MHRLVFDLIDPMWRQKTNLKHDHGVASDDLKKDNKEMLVSFILGHERYHVRTAMPIRTFSPPFFSSTASSSTRFMKT
jgi:hypothetical protein